MYAFTDSIYKVLEETKRNIESVTNPDEALSTLFTATCPDCWLVKFLKQRQSNFKRDPDLIFFEFDYETDKWIRKGTQEISKYIADLLILLHKISIRIMYIYITSSVSAHEW